MADQGTNPFFGDVITVLFPVTKSLPPSLFFSSPFVTPQLPFTFPSVQTLTGTAKIRFQPTRFAITIAINGKAFHGPHHTEPNGHLLLHPNHKLCLCYTQITEDIQAETKAPWLVLKFSHVVHRVPMR